MTVAPRELRLRMTSDPANLASVRREVEAFTAACGFPDPARGEIVLVVNEALANITRHAYGGAHDRPVELVATFEHGLLRITLRDWGCGEAPARRAVDHDPLQPGGVGLICLHRLMDTIRFTPQSDGMLLTMERRL